MNKKGSDFLKNLKEDYNTKNSRNLILHSRIEFLNKNEDDKFYIYNSFNNRFNSFKEDIKVDNLCNDIVNFINSFGLQNNIIKVSEREQSITILFESPRGIAKSILPFKYNICIGKAGPLDRLIKTLKEVENKQFKEWEESLIDISYY